MSTQRGNKNSDAIRILQRDRDASARATHLKAEIGMVPNSTIERKIMSTKTSIKRIALVAAAALALGGFSAVSASATTTTAALPYYVSVADSGANPTTATATMTATGIAGAYNYVTLAQGTALAAGTIGIALSSTTGSKLSVGTQPNAGVDTITVAADGLSATDSGVGASAARVKVSTPAAGTITVTISKNVDNGNGSFTNTALQTITITVNAASVVGAYSASNSFAVRVDTTTTTLNTFAAYETTTVPLTSASTDSTAAITKGTAGASVSKSIIAVRLLDTQATPVGIAGATVSASISGVGLVAGTGTSTDTHTAFYQSAATVASSTTNAAGWAFIDVLNGGAAGTGTVTITYNDGTTTYTVATKAFVFYGSLASIKATQGKFIVANSGTATGGTTSTTYAVQFTAADAAGNAVDITSTGLNLAGTIVGTSDNTTGIASTTSQTCATDATNALALDCSVTGATTGVAGSVANVTYSYTDASLVVYKTAAIAFTIGGSTVSSVAITFDKASYNVGDLVTASLTLKDSKGFVVADKTYSIFDTTTSTTVFATSAQLTTTPFGSRYVTTSKGIATATFYAPFTTGNLNVSATIGGTTGTAWNDAASTLAGTTVAGVAVVSASALGGDSSLAYDAASAATDAANNAYEEAQNATQAASDALAAVKALAVQVKALIALVNKIKAKLKA